jgi:hypothetical protein
MTTNEILSLLFSTIGALLLAYSTFAKNKSKMMYVQVADCSFNALACLFAGGYSGCVTCVLCGIRNCFNAKKKMPVWLLVVFCVLFLTTGIIFNQAGIIGWLPIIASLQYTICTAISNSTQKLRVIIIINTGLWLIYYIVMHLYPSICMAIIIIIASTFNLIRYRKKTE